MVRHLKKEWEALFSNAWKRNIFLILTPRRIGLEKSLEEEEGDAKERKMKGKNNDNPAKTLCNKKPSSKLYNVYQGFRQV